MRLKMKPMAGGIGGIIVAIVLLISVLGWYWSAEPQVFSVQKLAAEQHNNKAVAPGQVSTLTLIKLIETLLDKPGGYVSNDIGLPGIMLDNMPNWEFGVLVQVRDFSRAMRKDMSRSQSQSTENPFLAEAEPRLHYDSTKWWLESAESQYRNGMGYLRRYHDALAGGAQRGSEFYARADNLRVWLSDVETRLGSLSQRLSASVGRTALVVDGLDIDAGETEVQTPWMELDDVFYEARGSAWALLHLLNAVSVDFKAVLEKKNALVSLKQITRELEGALQPLQSPVVLNGSGMGLLANHSLVMASYIARANAAIIDLRELLAQG